MIQNDVLDVAWIDVDSARIKLASGEICPITNMIDSSGEETDDPLDADRIVFPLPNSRWAALCL